MTRRALADVGVARCALANLRASYTQELALLAPQLRSAVESSPSRLKMKDWRRLVLQVQRDAADEMSIHRNCNNF
jgi:hypothetical protein